MIQSSMLLVDWLEIAECYTPLSNQLKDWLDILEYRATLSSKPMLFVF